MKVDVQGFEAFVIEGGKQPIQDGHVENLFMKNSMKNVIKVGKMMDMLYGFRL